MVEPTASREFGPEEVGLALRNHGMLLEGLRYDVTPVGMHYLLIHFDVPLVDPKTYALTVGGRVRNPLRLTLEDVKRRPALTIPVTMECSGNGRAHLSPRPISAPWREEAVGCAEWTGTPLGPIFEEAGVLDDAVEIVFGGHDRGIDDGVEHDYERSMPVEEAMREEVLLVWGMNGYPLPPQHGAPLRLIVPKWYGMASVKWLKSITAVTEPFEGVQQTSKYHYKSDADDPGIPITSKKPHALMAPPGIPDYLSRRRHVRPGRVTVEGRAWSGLAVERVEFSAHGGLSWEDADLGEPLGPYAWVRWSYEWDAPPGEHELCVRATDAAGETQPLSAEGAWNYGGYGVNVVQRVPVTVGKSMSSRRKALLTPEEYLALERRSEARSEYVAGEVFAVVGASKRHNLIAANIIRVLGNQLLECPCNVYPSDLRVKVSATGKYTYPDVVVACEEERFEDAENDTLLNPVVIIEILSQSTEAYHRGKKFEHYQYIESLTEYILVAQEPYRIEQYVRRGDREWRYSEYHDAEDVVRIDVIGCELALRDAYVKVE